MVNKLSAEYADAAFDEEVSTDDPDYDLKKELFNEMREVRDECYAQGHRRFALRKKVREEMFKRHDKGDKGKDGKILNIIRILLSIFSIVLFFV